MFGNVFTAMESLIYLHHGKGSWCDIKILYNSTFEAFTNISIKTLIFASSCQIYFVPSIILIALSESMMDLTHISPM
jgi:hypothetical protein